MLHPLTAVVVAVVHVYLAFGHLSELFGGDMQWTHIWKGFGALAAHTSSRHWLRARLADAKVGWIAIGMKNGWKQIFSSEEVKCRIRRRGSKQI